MKRALIAIVVGVCIESAFVAMLALGGLGPCGPNSLLGSAVLLIHAPGVWALDAFRVGERATLILVPSGYAALWSLLAFLFFRGPRRNS
jgi:hypothetical protein